MELIGSGELGSREGRGGAMAQPGLPVPELGRAFKPGHHILMTPSIAKAIKRP